MKIKPKMQTSDNVTFERYNIARIRKFVPLWDTLPKTWRHWYCRELATPDHVGTVSNVTCDGLHEYVATAMTLSASSASRLDPPRELAFGDDDSSFSTTDTAMNNEVGERTPITDPSSTAKDFNIDEYLSSNEQNGNTLREVGIFSDNGVMWQHSATDVVYEKDDSFAIVVNVTIPISDAA